MPAHHTIDPVRHFGHRSSGSSAASPVDNGLHEQLLGTQAAASRARRGRTLRLALGFAAFGIAAAIWSGPNVEDAVYRVALAWQGAPADDFTTASIAPVAPRANPAEPRGGSYVIRRSVLTEPGVVCVVTETGSTCK